MRRLLLCSDVVAVFLAVVVTYGLYGHRGLFHHFGWRLFAVPLMILIFKMYGLYDRDLKRIGHSTLDDLPWLFHAAVIGGLLFWLYSQPAPIQTLPVGRVILFDVCVVGFVCGARALTRSLMGRLIGGERCLLIGEGEMAVRLAGKLAAQPGRRFEMLGMLAPVNPGLTAAVPQLPVLGDVDDLAEVATEQRVERVVLSGHIDESRLEELLRRCRALALKVSVLPRLSNVLGSTVEIDDVQGVTVLGLSPTWLPRSSRGIKRTMDLAVASLLLLLCAPLLLVAAILIKLDSPGPLLFSQERVGREGRQFRLFKLRTMVADAEQRREELLGDSTDPHWLKLDRDPRITRVGRWVRRFSIDELPQLWNVLRGEMSMVGPRPLIPAEDERVQGWARERLDLVPGLTGYWQVLGRTEIPFEEMIKLDYLYVVNWSIWEDVRLMLRTLPVVLTGRGAN